MFESNLGARLCFGWSCCLKVFLQWALFYRFISSFFWISCSCVRAWLICWHFVVFWRVFFCMLFLQYFLVPTFFFAILIFAVKCQNFSHISSIVLIRMTRLLEILVFTMMLCFAYSFFFLLSWRFLLCLVCNRALFFSCLRMRSVDVHCFSLYLLIWAVSLPY